MKIKIDHYIRVDFNGFSEIVDAVGGVEVEVAGRMYKPSEGINLESGRQILTGKQALGYVRYRDYSEGDIARASVQQQFLKDLADKILQPASLTKIPAFIKIAQRNVETDMGLKDITRVAAWAAAFQAEDIVTQTLPGYFYDVRDGNGYLLMSYWAIDKATAPTLLEGMFAGKQFVTVAQSNNAVKIVGTPAADLSPEPEEEEKEPEEKSSDPPLPADTLPPEAVEPEDIVATEKMDEEKMDEPGEEDTAPAEETAEPGKEEGAPPELMTIEGAPPISQEEMEWQRSRLEPGEASGPAL
jgi:hypothetical protein